MLNRLFCLIELGDHQGRRKGSPCPAPAGGQEKRGPGGGGGPQAWARGGGPQAWASVALA